MRVTDAQVRKLMEEMSKNGKVSQVMGAVVDVQFDDPEISRRHSRISRGAGGGFVVEDLGSRNGTWVNGLRVERTALAFGDKLRLGSRFPRAALVATGATRLPTDIGISIVSCGRSAEMSRRRSWCSHGSKGIPFNVRTASTGAGSAIA